jgi:hypothetical protein
MAQYCLTLRDAAHTTFEETADARAALSTWNKERSDFISAAISSPKRACSPPSRGR